MKPVPLLNVILARSLLIGSVLPGEEPSLKPFVRVLERGQKQIKIVSAFGGLAVGHDRPFSVMPAEREAQVRGWSPLYSKKGLSAATLA